MYCDCSHIPSSIHALHVDKCNHKTKEHKHVERLTHLLTSDDASAERSPAVPAFLTGFLAGNDEFCPNKPRTLLFAADCAKDRRRSFKSGSAPAPILAGSRMGDFDRLRGDESVARIGVLHGQMLGQTVSHKQPMSVVFCIMLFVFHSPVAL